jgi:hypothetical protein
VHSCVSVCDGKKQHVNFMFSGRRNIILYIVNFLTTMIIINDCWWSMTSTLNQGGNI